MNSHYKGIAASIGASLQSMTFESENTSDSADDGSAGAARGLPDVTPTIPSGARKKTVGLCNGLMERRVVDLEQIQTYLAKGADLNMKVTFGGIRGSNSLHCAAIAGNGMAVAAIIASGQLAQINEVDGDGLTPLALICGAKVLDKNICPRFNSTSEERDARRMGMEALLVAGANQYRMDRNNLRPIHHAAGRNLPGLIHRLVEQEQSTGIDGAAPTTGVVNCSDRQGNTPLHVAASHNALDATKTLLDLDAQTTLTNRHRQTPLHLLCMVRGHNNERGGELACLLLNNGVDGDLVDNRKMTWSDYAAKTVWTFF